MVKMNHQGQQIHMLIEKIIIKNHHKKAILITFSKKKNLFSCFYALALNLWLPFKIHSNCHQKGIAGVVTISADSLRQTGTH